MSENLQEKRQLEVPSVHMRRPHCFGKLKQHIIVCNECSKQLECLQKYNLHELPLRHA
jgi:hypothetical protein